jgi:hypothetical protein
MREKQIANAHRTGLSKPAEGKKMSSMHKKDAAIPARAWLPAVLLIAPLSSGCWLMQTPWMDVIRENAEKRQDADAFKGMRM